MKIEKGKTYTDREGGKVIVVENDNARDLYPLLAEYSDGCQCWINKHGQFYNGEQESRRDIVGEWIEPTDESGQPARRCGLPVDISKVGNINASGDEAATDESGQSPGFKVHAIDATQNMSIGVDHARDASKTIACMLMAAMRNDKPVICWDDYAATGYERLAGILQDAHDQAATGKGKERHANGKPFTEQPIMAIGRMCGLGFQTGQIQKKVQEATGMAARGEADAAIRELLGAINYAAAAVLLIREQKSAAQ